MLTRSDPSDGFRSFDSRKLFHRGHHCGGGASNGKPKNSMTSLVRS